MPRLAHLSRRIVLSAGATASFGMRIVLAGGDGVQFAVKAVAPGVFVHAPRVALASRDNRGDIANLGFIVGRDAVAVIDTGASIRLGRALAAAIATATDRPVRYVINTHMHFDHAMGNAAFAADGVTFIGHKNMPRALTARRETYVALGKDQFGEDPLQGGDIVLPTMLIETEAAIDLGQRRVTLKAWPAAHTDNDLTIHDETTATLFAGDLLFDRHIPVIDGSLPGWLKAMDALKSIPARRVVPGHGAAPAPWPEALEPQRRYLEKLAKDVRAAIKAGVPLGEAVKQAGQSERGNWELFEDFNIRNATTAYGELEWED
jgi:quinoprotein relay system zinc metallohydrolase 2